MLYNLPVSAQISFNFTECLQTKHVKEKVAGSVSLVSYPDRKAAADKFHLENFSFDETIYCRSFLGEAGIKDDECRDYIEFALLLFIQKSLGGCSIF